MVLHLDPRCKLYLLLIGNLLLFFHVSLTAEAILMGLFFIPFFFSSRRRACLRWMGIYLLMLALDQWLVPAADGLLLNWVSLLAVGIRMMMPCLLTGAYAFTTTTVGEFVCGLRRMKVPEAIVIPCMVVIRFFPTIREDYRQIKNAMILRGVVGGTAGLLRNPFRSLEYILIPLLMNSSSVAQDLSVAALTKGLGIQGTHTSMIELRFGAADAAMMLVCTAVLGLSIGGVL